MFPRSATDGDVQIQPHPHSLATIASRLASEAHPNSPLRLAVGALWQAGARMGAAPGRLGALTCDSRETLSSKEEQLASYGVSWATDLAYEDALVRELEEARQRRHAGRAAAPARSAIRPPVSRRLRWTLGARLIRTGQRLQGEQHIEAIA